MSNTREILTLQFGHYANHVGTHFWNIQEQSFNYTSPESEINHDILYREGQTNRGQSTYTPRLLLTDLKGSLKHLSVEGDLYEDGNASEEILTWCQDQTEIQKQPAAEKNLYQQSLDDPNTSIPNNVNIENDIQVWADFLYGRFHPRTVNLINEYQHNNTEAPFETFPAGTSIWKSFADDYTDKVRLYAEECDNIQGFQILFDAHDGFSGLASMCIDYLRDDFENKSILSIPIIPSYFNDLNFTNSKERESSTQKSLIRQINYALSLSSIYELSSLVVPISTDVNGWNHHGVSPRKFTYLNYDYQKYYHSSAILASALDTLTLRYRRKENSYLFHLCNDLNGSGRKLAAASLGLPFGVKNKEYLIESLDNWEGALWDILTPNCTVRSDRCMQSITLRGVLESKLKKPPQEESKHREMPAYKCSSVHEMLSFYLSCTSFGTASHVTVINKPLGIKLPYPDLFVDKITENGLVSSESRNEDIRVKEVPVITGLHSSADIGEMLERLYRETKRLKYSRFNEFQTAGLECDEYNEKLNQVMELRESYIEEHFL